MCDAPPSTWYVTAAPGDPVKVRSTGPLKNPSVSVSPPTPDREALSPAPSPVLWTWLGWTWLNSTPLFESMETLPSPSTAWTM